jgi:hypothetical protein
LPFKRNLQRYNVVRAKAGGRQSTKDAGGKTIKSAGSSIRRQNERMLELEVGRCRLNLLNFISPITHNL